MRLKCILAFIVAIISIFFITIFNAILFAWEMTLANNSIMNKKTDILLNLFCMRSGRRKWVFSMNRGRSAPLFFVGGVDHFRNFAQDISTSRFVDSHRDMTRPYFPCRLILRLPDPSIDRHQLLLYLIADKSGYFRKSLTVMRNYKRESP